MSLILQVKAFWNWLHFVINGLRVLFTEITTPVHKPSLPPAGSLNNKCVLITGGNVGIGLETARSLAKEGARVIIACRSLARGGEAVKDLIATTGNQRIECRECDVSSFASVRKFVQGLVADKVPLNILVLNAGVMLCPFDLTKDGFETHFATNHLGHFLMAMLLLDTLKQNGPSRVVVVSSEAHEGVDIDLNKLSVNSAAEYDAGLAYRRSKLANIMFAYELQRRLDAEYNSTKDGQSHSVNVLALHPGVVYTNINRHQPGIVNKLMGMVSSVAFKTPAQGAFPSIHAAVAPELEGVGGIYMENCEKCKSSPQSYNTAAAAALFEKSMKMVQLEK